MPKYIQGDISETLIKIVLITERMAELLRDDEHEVTVFRWSN